MPLNYKTGSRLVSVPAGFGWTPPFSIFQLAPNIFSTNIVERSLRVSTVRNIYVDIATGNDINPGTDPNAPKKSIWSAINLGGNDTIYVKEGTYGTAYSWSGLTPIQNVNVIGVKDFISLAPGKVISSVSAGTINGIVKVNVNICVENLVFIGGFGIAFLFQNGSGSFIDCEFSNSESLNNFEMVGSNAGITHTFYLIRCRFYNAAGDGVGSSPLGVGETVRFVEINCHSTGNGTTVGANQGSSHHGAVFVIRINGWYTGNRGPQNIADVLTNVKSWNLGVVSFRTTAAGTDTAFYCGNNGTMWLHGCIPGGKLDLQTDDASGTIYLCDTVYRTSSGPGTITTYVG